MQKNCCVGAKVEALEKELNDLMESDMIVKLNTVLVVFTRAKMTHDFYVKNSGKERDFKLNRSLQNKVMNSATTLTDISTQLWKFCKEVANEMSTAVVMEMEATEKKIIAGTLAKKLDLTMNKLLKLINVCLYLCGHFFVFFGI